MNRKTIRRTAALVLFLILLAAGAKAEIWHAAAENIPRFEALFSLMKDSCEPGTEMDREAAEAILDEIRAENGDDGFIAGAITDHWYANVLDPAYRMFIYRGEEKAEPLARSPLEFGEKHAFVVLGFQLEDGEMTWELAGRCDAAAAAARAFPEALVVTTGGATGGNNPEGHTEAGEMKKYLVETHGIDGDRIFTDPDAMTTAENAVNCLRILKEQGVETYTIVTSNYHQRWAQILFNAVAAVYGRMAGYSPRLVGNYNFMARPEATNTSGCRTGLSQLSGLLQRSIGTGP